MNTHLRSDFKLQTPLLNLSTKKMAMDELQTPTAPLPSPKTNYPNDHSSPTAFSYTFSESMMQENIENAEAIINKWDPNTPSLEKFMSLFLERREEAHEFIDRVDHLRRAMHFLVARRGSDHRLVLANNLMTIAMLRLEKEFLQVLLARRDYLNPKSVSSIGSGSSGSSEKIGSISLGKDSNEGVDDCDDVGCDGDDRTAKIERSMADLKTIAKSMISSGYSKECGKVYRITRKLIVDEELNRLGFRNYNQALINKMNEEVLEQHVTKWIHRAKLAVTTVFQGERVLCDHVFDVSETIKQTCIAHIVMEGATNLFKFAEMVAKSKRSPDKIFLMMNLFEGISEIWPEIESIFSYESLSPIKIQALSAIHKLSDSAQTILAEFVSSIQKNSSKTPVPGGGIHPMTCSVMDYVSLLADHSGALSDILADEEETATAAAQSPFPESYFDSMNPTSGVASRLAWIILVLLCKLDSKAELYKDMGLSYLFLANNLQFIVDKVATSSVKLLLGQDWISKLQRKVKIYASNYESIAWGDVLSSLPPAPPSEANETFESPQRIKQNFRRFCSAFEAAYRKQSSCVVPNAKLRDEIKASITGKLVPAYREFYHRYLVILSEAKNFEALVKFSPDNLGNYLSELFHRSLISENSSSSPSSSSLSSSSFESKLPGCL